jgi:hypothetical protein
MARLHFEAEHTEPRHDDDKISLAGNLPQVLCNVERVKNDPFLGGLFLLEFRE